MRYRSWNHAVRHIEQSTPHTYLSLTTSILSSAILSPVSGLQSRQGLLLRTSRVSGLICEKPAALARAIDCLRFLLKSSKNDICYCPSAMAHLKVRAILGGHSTVTLSVK